jgi:hypothetical protein
MAEMPRQLTQAEIDRILFQQKMNMQPQSIQNLSRNVSGAVTPVAPNFAQMAAGGASRVGQFLNQILPNAQQVVAANPLNLERLFPTTNAQPQVTIPTGFNFAPKQDTMGGVIPGGLQSQQVDMNQLLRAIQPADMLGVSSAERVYTDVGMGKAPNTMDVIDTLALGAGGMAAGRGLLKAGKGLPVGMSVQDAPGLLQAAPKSDIGFYSAVEQAAMASPRKSATGQAFLNDIMKGPDVRADEIKWMGLDDYLKGKQNVTKQEVQDYIANNRVNVKEVRLGESVAEDPIGIAKRKAVFDKYEPEIQALYKQMDSLGYGTPHNVTYEIDNKLRYLQNKRDYEADAAYVVPEPIPTRHSQWQLPGGENYRELLLTMPNKNMGGLDAAQIQAGSLRKQTTDLMADWKRISEEKPGSPEAVSAYEKVAESRRAMNQAETAVEEMKKAIREKTYSSSHFSQPNILAHLRVNDRVDADGKKMLLIEEVQSDWHQIGREKGYKGQLTSLPDDYFVSEMKRSDDDIVYEIRKKSDPDVLINRDYNRQSAINGAVNLLNETVMGVPDAPFKDTWYQLALKRAIQHAAENGYDRIGLTTGSQQVARFDLSKQVDNLLYSKNTDGTYRVSAQVQGRGQMLGESIPESKLADYVGKEVAERMSKGVGNKTEVAGEYDPVSMTSSKKYMTELSGDGLKIGGEGMKKYYDEIYPKFLDKYGKKWGARVGDTTISTGRSNVGGVPSMYPDKEPIRYLDITPEMKAGVSKGQPLFQAAPIIGTGLLGSQQEER